MTHRPLALSFVGLMLLAGCAATPVTDSSATSNTPTPTVEPEPELEPSVLSIEVGTSDVSVVDSEGTIVTYDHYTPGDELVTAFTEVFGAEPEQIPYPGHLEAKPGTDFVWGGFTLRVQDFEPVPPSDGRVGYSNISYWISSADVGEVAVSSNGVAVGDPGTDLPVCPGSAGETFYDANDVLVMWRCTESVSLGDDTGYEIFDSVKARVAAESGLVIELFAPAPSYGN